MKDGVEWSKHIYSDSDCIPKFPQFSCVDAQQHTVALTHLDAKAIIIIMSVGLIDEMLINI